jgi:calcineurin-like phosphoesterase family protein
LLPYRHASSYCFEPRHVAYLLAFPDTNLLAQNASPAIEVRPPRIANLLKQLNGTKHLIIGNNDGAATTDAVRWENVEHYADIAFEDVRLILCHYPFRTWNGISKGSYNLHGHSHGRLTPMRRQVDVGVDVWEFRPISLDVLRTRRAAKRPRRH